jgi:hypothetical protein
MGPAPGGPCYPASVFVGVLRRFGVASNCGHEPVVTRLFPVGITEKGLKFHSPVVIRIVPMASHALIRSDI